MNLEQLKNFLAGVSQAYESLSSELRLKYSYRIFEIVLEVEKEVTTSEAWKLELDHMVFRLRQDSAKIDNPQILPLLELFLKGDREVLHEIVEPLAPMSDEELEHLTAQTLRYSKILDEDEFAIWTKLALKKAARGNGNDRRHTTKDYSGPQKLDQWCC